MSCRLWIVWLMLALLPLRGWAVVSMAMPAVVAPAVAAHADALIAGAAEMAEAGPPACHETGGEASGNPGDTGHACHLCDLCHGVAADLADSTLPSLPLPTLQPLPTAARDTGRQAVGGLERPPRFFLA